MPRWQWKQRVTHDGIVYSNNGLIDAVTYADALSRARDAARRDREDPVMLATRGPITKTERVSLAEVRVRYFFTLGRPGDIAYTDDEIAFTAAVQAAADEGYRPQECSAAEALLWSTHGHPGMPDEGVWDLRRIDEGKG